MPTAWRATPDDHTALTDVLSASYLAGPVAAWLIPHAERRGVIVRDYAAVVLRHGLAHGHVDTVADRTAVAIWHPRPASAPTRQHQGALTRATAEYASVFSLTTALCEKHHPDLPHHYLAHLAVHPGHQHRGHDSTLIRHHHTHLDSIGMPAYTEATTTDKRTFYLDHGYQAGEPFTLADGPLIWPMWRPSTPITPPGFHAHPPPTPSTRARKPRRPGAPPHDDGGKGGSS
ncbi:GNAT family N-acetyltransferase [Micromonospora sp. CA-263727]|uniref:GNAT family N-acetyltransferase n=1 Tax=Micromonospora sp. CA-263727 TaxID=3239967 RepID=UPI003D8EE89B